MGPGSVSFKLLFGHEIMTENLNSQCAEKSLCSSTQWISSHVPVYKKICLFKNKQCLFVVWTHLHSHAWNEGAGTRLQM